MTDLPDSSERRVAINTLSKYAAQAAGMVTSFVLTPFLINAIGPTLLGLKTLASQSLQFVGLASSSLGVSYNKFAAGHYARGEFDRMNAVLSAGFGFSLVSGGIFAAGTLLAAAFADRFFGLPPDILAVGRIVILITGFATTFHILSGVWKSPVFIRQRFYLSAGAETISALGSALAVWAAFHYRSPSIIVWVLIDCGFRVGSELFFMIPLCRRALPQMRIRLGQFGTRAQMKEMVGFGGLNFVGQLGFLLYYATDSILISNLAGLGPSRIVYYNLAQRWDPLLHSLLMAFATVLTPLMTADFAVGNRERVAATLVRATRYCLILALYPCVLLVAFAGPFLHTWVGGDFAEVSAPVMRAIMTAFVITAPSVVGFEVLIACGRLGRAVTAVIVGGVVNVVLSVTLVKVFGLGLLGIALGSVIPLALTNGLYVPVQVCREAGLPVGRYLRQAYLRPLLAAVPLALGAWLLRRTWEAGSLVTLFVQFAILALPYAAAIWFLALEAGDRRKTLLAAAEGWRLTRSLIGR